MLRWASYRPLIRCRFPGPQLPAQATSRPVSCASAPAANAPASSCRTCTQSMPSWRRIASTTGLRLSPTTPYMRRTPAASRISTNWSATVRLAMTTSTVRQPLVGLGAARMTRKVGACPRGQGRAPAIEHYASRQTAPTHRCSPHRTHPVGSERDILAFGRSDPRNQQGERDHEVDPAGWDPHDDPGQPLIGERVQVPGAPEVMRRRGLAATARGRSVTVAAPGAGEVEAEREAREPDHKTDCGADDRGCRTVGAGASCSDDDGGADQCGDRVQPLAEHDGDLADKDVAEDAAADARDRAEDDGGCGGEAVVECGTRTSDAEEREAGRVQYVDWPSNPAEERRSKDGDDTGAAGDGKVAPVTDGGGRDADQQVAGDAAGEADNDGEHDDAKKVEPCAHACHAAAEPERERPREVEDQQQHRFLLGVHQQGRQPFRSEHAIALVERDLQRVEPSPLVPHRPLGPPAGLRSADADAEHGHRAAVESLYREGDRLIATTLRQDVQE